MVKSSDNINRTAGVPGDTFRITIGIVNQGTIPSAASKVYYYFGTQTNVLFGNPPVGMADCPPLAAGATAPGLAFDFTVPQGTPADTYALGYWIDAPDVVQEKDENNNQSIWPNIRIDNPPANIDLKITGIVHAGNRVTITWVWPVARSRCQLQTRAGLTAGTWRNLGGPASETIVLDLPESETTAFYRLVSSVD